jgi:hypothetical protein
VLASATVTDPSRTNEVLSCTPGGATDPDDGDAVDFTWSWTVDGVDNGDSTLLSGSAFDRGQKVVCTITPIDQDGLAGASKKDSVVISNAAPRVTDVTFDRTTYYTNDAIIATPTSSDDDGDPRTFRYTWYVAGVAQTDLDPNADRINGAAVGMDGVGTRFSKGQLVYVVVTPNDGIVAGAPYTSSVLTIANTAPQITSAAITPDTVKPCATATCTASGWTDVDGDTPQYSYIWTRSGSATPVRTSGPLSGADTLNGSNFDEGHTITCAITATDGENNGTTRSDSASVHNGAPSLDSLTLGPTPLYTDRTAQAVAPYTDPDGDAVTVEYRWSINGTYVVSDASWTTLSTLSGTASTSFNKTNTVSVEARPTDVCDTGATRTAGPITVSNSAPSGLALSMLPAAYPVAGVDDIRCVIATLATDPDPGDAVSYTFLWEVNGVPFNGATLSTYTGDPVPKTQTVEHELWECTVTPRDPEGLAGPSSTASVTVDYCLGKSRSCSDVSLSGETRFTGGLSGTIGHAAGLSVGRAGDVDGDGLSDFLVGLPYQATGANSETGAAALFLTSRVSTWAAGGSISSVGSVSILGQTGSDNAGWSVGPAGDYNLDGYADIVIGSKDAPPGIASVDSGAAYVLSGKVIRDNLVTTTQWTINNPTVALTWFYGVTNDDRTGWAVASADFDGDAGHYPDYVVGAPQSSPDTCTSSNGPGTAYLHIGGLDSSARLITGARGPMNAQLMLLGETVGNCAGRQRCDREVCRGGEG